MPDLGFWSFAERDPTQLALAGPDGVHWTRGELFALQNRLSHGLRALGLRRGDAVAIALPNCAEFLALHLACAQSGWYLVPINWHLAAGEIAYLLRDSEAKIFVAHERIADVCRTAADEAGFPAERRFALGSVSGFRPYAQIADGQPAHLPPDRSPGLIMNYTSGTTGRPKGVRRPLPSGDLAMVTGAGLLLLFGIKPEDGNVHLVGSPLYHTAVISFASWSLHSGHALVLMDKWTPEETLRLIEEYRVTTSHMVPTQFHRMLALPPDVRERYDCSSTRAMIHAAAPCPPEIKQRMLDWWGDSIHEYYAATEGGGTFVLAADWRRHPGTVGKPWPTADVKIYDDAHHELPAGQIGTVYMRLSNLEFEYYKDAEKTRENRIGRYFTVGDVGYLNEEGYLFLCDRKIDMIISGGANIYPAEIEAVLLEHPKVGDAAVFGIPNEDWGEEVKAVIEPAAGCAAGAELAAEILAFCADRLARFKTPRTIDFVAELPRDPSGKLRKRILRDPYWKNRSRAI